MSESPAARSRPDLLKWALWGVAVVGVAAVLYIIGHALIKPGAGGSLESLKKGEMAKLVIPAEPAVTPATTFYDEAGAPVRLADFRGQVVVLNLWATWCPPCVAEMPTLAKLQAEYAGHPVRVIALSVDRGDDIAKAKLFLAQHRPLAFYNDPKLKLAFDLTPPAPGMPTTLIFGKDGVERARLSGGADWSGPDAKAIVDKVLADG